MAFIRQGGVVNYVPDSDLSLKDKIAQSGGVAPTTPKGAESIGASPHQSKMVGTEAQRTPILEEQVSPEQSLAAAERLDQPTTPFKQLTPEEKASMLVDIESAGSLGKRVREQVAKRLRLEEVDATDAQAGIPATSDLKTQFALDDDKAEELHNYFRDELWQVLNQQDPANIDNALAYLQTNFGITNEQAESYLGSVAKNTPAMFAKIYRDELQLSDLYDAAEYADLKTRFPIKDGMTVKQFQDLVQAERRDSFSQIARIEARLRGAVPGSARAKMLKDQLAQMGAVGLRAVETSAARLADQIAAQPMITVGDSQMSLEEILDDDYFTQEIGIYLNLRPEDRANDEFALNFPEIAQWAETNATALENMATTVEGVSTSFNKNQTTWADLADYGALNGLNISDDLLKSMVPSWDPSAEGVSAGTLTQSIRELKESPIWALANASHRTTFGIENDTEMEKALKDIFANATAEDFKNYDAKTMLKRYTNVNDYNRLAGMLPGVSGMPGDTIALSGDDEKFKLIQEVTDNLKSTDKARYASIQWDKIPEEDWVQLSANIADPKDGGTAYSTYKRMVATKSTADLAVKTDDPDTLWDAITGGGPATPSLDEMNNALGQLQEMSAQGVVKAGALMHEFHTLDRNSDGKIDAAELKKAASAVAGQSVFETIAAFSDLDLSTMKDSTNMVKSMNLAPHDEFVANATAGNQLTHTAWNSLSDFEQMNVLSRDIIKDEGSIKYFQSQFSNKLLGTAKDAVDLVDTMGPPEDTVYTREDLGFAIQLGAARTKLTRWFMSNVPFSPGFMKTQAGKAYKDASDKLDAAIEKTWPYIHEMEKREEDAKEVPKVDVPHVEGAGDFYNPKVQR